MESNNTISVCSIAAYRRPSDSFHANQVHVVSNAFPVRSGPYTMLDTGRPAMNKEIDWVVTYLSLPKKGSSAPFALRTQNHGHPNAPRSRASFVLSFNRCLNGALFADDNIAFASSELKCDWSVSASVSDTLTSLPFFHIASKMSKKAEMNTSGCFSLIKHSARCGNSDKMGKNSGVLTSSTPKYCFARALS